MRTCIRGWICCESTVDASEDRERRVEMFKVCAGKSREMESDDRQQIYGETARANKQTSGERLKVHLWRVSGGTQTDGCLNCQKKKKERERDRNSPPTSSLSAIHREREKLSVRSLRV